MSLRKIALAVLLATGLAATPALAQQAPASLLQPPVTSAEPEAVQQAVPTKAPGGLQDAIIIESSARQGGRGHFRVEVAQVEQPGIDAHDVRVRVSTGYATRISKAAGVGWRCAVAGKTWVCRKPSIHGTQVVAPIHVTALGLKGLKVGQVGISSHLTWVQRTDANNVAAVMQKAEERGKPGAKPVMGRDSTHTFLPVAPPLVIKGHVVGPVIHPMGKAEGTHTATIHALVGGLDGDIINLRWSQRCLTRADAKAVKACKGVVAPRAGFLDPVVSRLSEPEVGMRVHLPDVRRRTPLVFEMSVNDTGDVARTQVTIIPTPIAQAKYAARLGAFQDALKKARPAADLTKPAGVHTPTTRTGMREHLSKDGKHVTLTPQVAGGIKSVTWSSPVGGSGEIAGAKRSGISITVPTGTKAAVLEAKVETKTGDAVEVPTAVPPKQPAAPKVAKLTLPNTPQQQTLCAAVSAPKPLPTSAGLADGSATPDIALPSGEKIWLGSVQGAQPCDVNTKATFTGGIVMFGTWGLQQVTGTVSASGGLVISGGAMRIPDSWLAGAPPQLVAQAQGASAAMPFTVPSSAQLGSRLDVTGKWSAFGGEFVIPTGIDVLPLPAGWKFEPARLRLEPAGRVGLIMEARAPPGQSGSVLISGSIGTDSSASLDVTAAGVALFKSANGDQAALNMQGALRITPAMDSTTGKAAVPARSVWDVRIQGELTNVRPFDNVLFRKVSVQWTLAGFEMSTDMRIGSDQRYVDMKTSGKYVSAEDWSLNIDWAGNWNLGQGATIATLKGSLVRKDKFTTLDVKGTAAGWKPSPAFEMKSLTASLNNACAEADKTKCNPLAVKATLVAEGSVSTGGTSPIAWNGSASVDLTTGKFTVSGGLTVPDGGIGPEQLKLRSINMSIANDGSAGVCAPKTPQATAGTRITFTALGTVLGKSVDFTGEYESGAGGGYCLVGRLTDMPSDVPNAKQFNNIFVAYSSRDASISGEIAGNATVTLPESQLVINAQFKMPDFMNGIGVTGVGTFKGTIGLSPVSIDADITWTPAERKIFIGEANDSNMGLDAISVGFAWQNGALTFDATAQMSYVTPASETAAASSTPIKASVGVSVAANGTANVFIDGGVDTSQITSGEVANGFGVDGLTIRQLRVTARIGVDATGTPDPSMAFDAQVSLPDRWVGPLGVKPGTVVTLAANIQKTSPCFQFDISRARPEDGELAVDLANKGLIGARKMGVILAPAPGGCKLGSTADARVLPQGFSVQLDGVIGKDFNVKFGAEVRLPTVDDPTAFYLKAELKLDAFDIGGAVSVQKTDMSLLIDTKNSAYGLTLKGGVDVMGSKVAVNLDVQSTGLGNLTIKGGGAADISVGGFGLKGYVDMNVDIQGGTLKTLSVDLTASVKVMGVTLADARGDLMYDQGLVKRFQLALKVTIPLFWKTRVEGSVEVLYELGKGVQQEQAPVITMPARMRVAVGGRIIAFGWDSGAFRKVIVDWTGTADTPAPPAEENVDVAMGGTQTVKSSMRLPVLRYHALDYAAGSDMTYDNEGYRDYRVVGLTYTANMRAASQGGNATTSQVTGGLSFSTCPESKVSADGVTCAVATSTVQGVIHFEDKRIQVVNGGTTGVMQYDAGQMKCTASCASKDVNLTGGEWDAAVALIEEARTVFAKANTGNALPPVDVWTYDAPAPTTP
ncbi:MAG: hypothetical protein ACOYL4_07895 [Miltoncostaeaceae bacterium]